MGESISAPSAPSSAVAPSSGPRIADLVAPVICAHRNASFLAPENTLEGMRYAVALPNIDLVDVGDFRTTWDGACVAVHDQTLDAKTKLAAYVVDYPLSALRVRNIVDASAWFGGGWADTIVPTAEEILSEFGGKKPLTFEAKTLSASDRLAELIDQQGIAPSILFLGANTSLAQAGVEVGAVGCIYRTSSQMATDNVATIVAQMQAGNVEHIQIEHGSSLVKIQEFITAGMKVWIYNIFRHYQFDDYAGMDIFGYVLDDPVYTPNLLNPAAYRRTIMLYPYTGTYGAGHFPASHTIDPAARGSFIGVVGAWRWQPGAEGYVMLGEISPVANPTGSYTVTVPITFDTLPSDMTKWAGFFFGQPTDLGYQNSVANADRDGYNLILRANGDAALYRVTDGVTTQIGSTSAMPDLAAGATVTLTIAVTAAGITVTRSDGGAAISSSDTTYRGGYMFAGLSGFAQGLRVSFGAIAVT